MRTVAMFVAIIATVGTLVPEPSIAQESRQGIPPTVAHVAPSEIEDFEKNPLEVQALLRDSLDLTRANLGYLFGSSNPKHRGMDCSGTIFYLLNNAGIRNVPRSSEGIYQWVRKESTFHLVNALRLDSTQFLGLRPGDLLFWTGTYEIGGRDLVTHTMIYLGRAKSDGLLLMVGSSDGRTYRGKKCYGVSVFDFRLPNTGSKSRFIGFASVPGLVAQKHPE